MRFFKRVLSALLAVTMCIPSGMMSVTMAAETDDIDTSYVVVLENSENGKIAFTDSEDDFMTFSESEKVEVVLIPDEGYQVENFTLRDMDTEKTVASKKTTDNIFSFAMPAKNISISAEFVKSDSDNSSFEDIGTTDSTKTDGDSYEVIDENADNFEIADNDIVEDFENEFNIESSRTTNYIANNLNDNVVEEVSAVSSIEIVENAEPTIVQNDTDKAGLMPTYHEIRVGYNLIDMSATKLANVGFDSDALISSVSQTQQIYAVDGNEDCFVAFIDIGKLNGVGNGVNVSFSNSNIENVVSYNNVINYDSETGIAYIPKSLFYNEEGEEIVVDIQAQVYVPYSLEEQNKNLINIEIENNNISIKEVAEKQKIAVPSLDVTTTFPLTTPETAENLDITKVHLYINDVAQPTVFGANEYFFNTETGELTISAIPVTIYSIKVVIDGESVASRMFSSLSNEAEADIARQVRYESDIKMIPDVYLDINYDDLKTNQSQTIASDVAYHTNATISAEDEAVVEKYFEYLCYVGQNYTNSKWAADAIYNGSAQLGDFVNDTRTDFGDSTGTALTPEMLELYNYTFTLADLTNAGTNNNNQKLPLHSVMLFQGQNAEGDFKNTVASDLASRPLRQEVTVRCLHKDRKNGIEYGVFGFAVSNTDGNVAAYGIYKIPVNTPVGYIQIQKESANPDVTENNDAYSFEGAQFVITNETGTRVVDEKTGKDVFTLDKNGVSEPIAVPTLPSTTGATYTVTEITAPLGFKVDFPKVVTVNTSHTASSPAVVTFTEEPYTYNSDIVLDKFDEISTYSEGNASLAGIKYEILYYAGYGIDEFTSLPKNPTRKWVVATQEREEYDKQGILKTYGHMELQPQYLIDDESDELYMNGKTVVLPLGTYVVRELDAGDGYTISGEMYVMQDGVKEPNTSSGKQGTTNPAQGLMFMVKANIPETDDYRTEIDPSGNRLPVNATYKTTGYVGSTPSGKRNTNIIRPESTITATNVVKYSGFSLQKLDLNDRTNNPQGNTDSMSGKYGVKNISDHAVAIKPENGIWINAGYASDTITKDGITYYIFEPVEENNMEEYMFTFNTNYFGEFTSSNSLLPYGEYRIDELIAPFGYQKNGVVVSKFSITENGTVVKAPDIQNMVQRGGIFLVKFDAEDETSSSQGSSTIQGTYTVKNKSNHYVWILDSYEVTGNQSISIIKENADKKDGARFVTGEGTWYKFAPDTDMFTFTTEKKGGYEAVYQSEPYLLPYGTYEIRETGTHPSYIISDLRQGNNVATFSITYHGEIVEFGTHGGSIIDSSAIMANPVARGGFTMQKNDADRKDHTDGTASSRVPQGDASFNGATYKVTTNSKNYVWIKEDADIVIMTDNAVSSKEINGAMWYKFTTGADMFTFRVDAEGNYTSSTDMLPFGTYTISEVSASEGYLNTTNRDGIISHQITITSEGQIVDLTYAQDAKDNEFVDSFYEEVIRGGVEIQKNDADVYDYLSQTAQGDATFEGAVYDIYNISNSYVWVDTNDDGVYSNSEYYKPIDLNIADETLITYEDVKNFTPIYTITTNKDGFASTGNKVLPYGSYLVVERTPSTGYLSTAVRDGIVAHTFEIREEGVVVDKLVTNDNHTTNTFYEAIIRGGFEFQKNDEETGTNVPLGGADLRATFSVTNVSNGYVWIKDEDGITLNTEAEDHYYDEETGYHLYGKNEIMFTFDTDATTGKFVTSENLLPYGSYKITEILPPTGYLVESNKNSGMSAVIQIREEGVLHDATNLIYNYVMRGNVFFEKKDAETGIKMPYIPFMITSLDKDGQPIESHIVYTDKNGSFSSSSDYTVHSYKTNKADETIEDIDNLRSLIFESNDDAVREYLQNGEYYNADSIKGYFERENYGMGLGVWFGVNTTPIDWERTSTLSTTGALPFGRYRLDELPCEANKGKALVHDNFTIANEAHRTTQKNNPLRWQLGAMAAGNINFGTIYNWEQPLAPQMTTEATVRGSNTQFGYPDNTMVITDVVHYQGIIKDKDYTVVAMVADVETGEFLRDVTGDIAMTTEHIHPNTTDGYVKMEISVDTTAYKGKTIVVYETIYDEHGDVFLSHTDPHDEKQQIHFPSLSTGVIVEKTNEQISLAEKSVTVIDTVSFSNLSAGTSYTIKSYLIDSETGAVVEDASGNRVESEQPFKPTATNGTFNVTFTFDASEMVDKKLIVCEEILENGYVIASNAEVAGDNQAVWFPEVTTNISNKANSTQMALADGNIAVVDKISYSMVKPGLNYTINGELVDVESGEVLATAKTSFRPSRESGSSNVTFTFNGDNLEGRTTVAYATVNYNSITVGEHKDITDTNEMIYFPVINTVATDAENKFKLSKADKEVTIIDTVEYSNLMTGYDYIVSGYLVDVDTGLAIEDANGNVIAASENFSATQPNGNIDVTFTFDGSKLANKTVVAYETINVVVNGNTPLVAAHEDINDENQTIRFPKLVTSAVDDTNKNHITKPGTSVLVDEVKYSNVIAGVEYNMAGKLVIKETREIIATTNIKFTPTSDSGVVTVQYEVDTSELAGKTLVFIEDLQYNGYSVAEVNNLNDKTETIYIPSLTTSAIDGENGTHVSNADESVTIVDTVTYTNLLAGKQYVMMGKIVDQATGEVLSSYIIDEKAYDERGEMHESWTCEECHAVFYDRAEVLTHIDESDTCENYQYELYYDKIHHDEVGHYGEIMAVKPFVASSPNGTVIMEFNFDGATFENRTLVVYEELYMANEDGIVLTENYDCMQCDAHYNTKVEVEEHFRQSTTGCNTYSFYYTTEMFSVAEHKDRYEEEQSVHIPKLTNSEKGANIDQISKLTASAMNIARADTEASIPVGNHYVKANENAIVHDTVTYENLIPGLSYTIVGTLVNRETGAPTNIETSYTFVPTEPHNDVELVFEFDPSTYAGELLVATEVAYINGNDKVATYYDLSDDTKTIYVVTVDSEIKDDSTGSNTPAYGKTTITDTITVNGLKPGTTYIGVGKLVNPATGEEYKNIEATLKLADEAKDIVVDGEKDKTDESLLDVIVDSFKEPFTSKTSNRIEFVANSVSTKFNITYELDTSTMSGESVVSYVDVFEKDTDTPIGDHKDPEDEDQTLHVAKITTSKIVDAYTKNAQAMLGKTAIAETVTFENLVTGKDYVVKGILKDAITGEVVAVVDETITTDATTGNYQTIFYIDTTKAIGRMFTITEEVYMNDVKVAVSEDNEDIIYVAEITTNAVNADSSSQSAPVAGMTRIIDTVTYKNLIVGEKYTVTGSLADENGNTITVYADENRDAKENLSVEFVPDKANGTVQVSFLVDTKDMEGKKLVGFETITLNNVVVAEHKNPDDYSQTVYVPTIKSTSKDKNTDTIMISHNPTATIVDNVTVGNLVVGQEYKLESSIYDKETNLPVSETSKTFVADAKEMTVEMEITLNSLEYQGKVLESQDALILNGVTLIKSNKHELNVGAVSTSVKDKTTGISVAEFDKDAKIIDTVSYKNFVSGLEYVIHGELISKKTGKVIDTEEITKVFTESDGKVEVEFEIDTTKFDGRQLVAIEKITLNGVEVATHDDIEDEAQTLNVAIIGTEAFINGQKEVKPDKSTLLVDTVNYDNLKPGYEYDMVGTIINAETGQVVECNGVPVTSTVSFTPTAPNGEVNVNFTFDTTALENKKLVVYEELKYNYTLVAEHKNINDAKQTVKITSDAPIVVENAKVIVKYVDENKKEIATQTEFNGKVGDNYNVKPKTITGYELVTTPENASGVMTKENIEVVFVYKLTKVEAEQATITVRYLDENNNAIATASVVTAKIGSSYEVKAKNIVGYTLKTMPANAKGKLTANVEVVFIYTKNSTTDNGSISNVNDAKVTVEYKDVNGNTIAEKTVIEGKSGESYLTTAKTITGYTLSTTPSNAKGIMKAGNITVTYLYNRVNNTTNNNNGNNTNNNNNSNSSNNTNNGNVTNNTNNNGFNSNNSNTVKDDGSTITNVKTGDYYAVIIIVILLATGLGIAGFVILRKKK